MLTCDGSQGGGDDDGAEALFELAQAAVGYDKDSDTDKDQRKRSPLNTVHHHVIEGEEEEGEDPGNNSGEEFEPRAVKRRRTTSRRAESQRAKGKNSPGGSSDDGGNGAPQGERQQRQLPESRSGNQESMVQQMAQYQDSLNGKQAPEGVSWAGHAAPPKATDQQAWQFLNMLSPAMRMYAQPFSTAPKCDEEKPQGQREPPQSLLGMSQQLPSAVPQRRFRYCASHVYIAHFINYQQHMSRNVFLQQQLGGALYGSDVEAGESMANANRNRSANSGFIPAQSHDSGFSSLGVPPFAGQQHLAQPLAQHQQQKPHVENQQLQQQQQHQSHEAKQQGSRQGHGAMGGDQLPQQGQTTATTTALPQMPDQSQLKPEQTQQLAGLSQLLMGMKPEAQAQGQQRPPIELAAQAQALYAQQLSAHLNLMQQGGNPQTEIPMGLHPNQISGFAGMPAGQQGTGMLPTMPYGFPGGLGMNPMSLMGMRPGQEGGGNPLQQTVPSHQAGEHADRSEGGEGKRPERSFEEAAGKVQHAGVQ